jgi:hypothetical protein
MSSRYDSSWASHRGRSSIEFLVLVLGGFILSCILAYEIVVVPLLVVLAGIPYGEAALFPITVVQMVLDVLNPNTTQHLR